RVCWRETSQDDYCRSIEGIPGGSAFKYGMHGVQGEWLGKTLSRPDQATRFAVLGDLGDGGPAQKRVAAVLESASVQFALLTGDIAYPGGAAADYEASYFPIYAKTIDTATFFPAVGNRDYGDSWFASSGDRRFYEGYHGIFHRPKYYSFDSGPAHF